MKTTKTSAEAYLISRDRLEGMLETLEIMANPAAMKAIAGIARAEPRITRWTSWIASARQPAYPTDSGARKETPP